MNAFLLVYCCNVDDLPVGLFATHEEARERAKHPPAKNPLGVDGGGESGFVCWKILEFRDGSPHAVVEVIEEEAWKTEVAGSGAR